MTIYSEIKALGVEIDSHESDLYCPATPETKKILESAFNGKGAYFSLFMDGSVMWYDVPFAFDPWWEAKP